MPSQIPSYNVGVLLTDGKLFDRNWYNFFLMLFRLSGAGQANTVVPVGAVSATLDFPNTVAQHSSDLTVAVPGAADGDMVTLGVPNACALANACYTGWVSAPGIVTVRFNNYSAAALNPPSGSFKVVVAHF